MMDINIKVGQILGVLFIIPFIVWITHVDWEEKFRAGKVIFYFLLWILGVVLLNLLK